MADELIENAEYGRKRKDEEPPILVAQRFLNIYRQMHIFNRERQEEFDNMLISTTPEVRILLSTLPGGGLLLEHISEIEQKKGVVSTFPSKQVITRKKDLNSNLQATPDHVEQHSHSGGGGVVIDASFASELSSSLSAALQQTEKKHKEEIKALAKELNTVVIASGPIDIISDGDVTFGLENGDAMMPLITGSGCMLTTIMGSYVGANEPLIGGITACALMAVAGESAAVKGCERPG